MNGYRLDRLPSHCYQPVPVMVSWIPYLPLEKRSADSVKTFSTGIAGFVHPGGGSFSALTHDATTQLQLIDSLLETVRGRSTYTKPMPRHP